MVFVCLFLFFSKLRRVVGVIERNPRMHNWQENEIRRLQLDRGHGENSAVYRRINSCWRRGSSAGHCTTSRRPAAGPSASSSWYVDSDVIFEMPRRGTRWSAIPSTYTRHAHLCTEVQSGTKWTTESSTSTWAQRRWMTTRTSTAHQNTCTQSAPWVWFCCKFAGAVLDAINQALVSVSDRF